MNLLSTAVCTLVLQTAPDMSQDDWRMYQMFLLTQDGARRELCLTTWQVTRVEEELKRYAKAYPGNGPATGPLTERMKQITDVVRRLHEGVMGVLTSSQKLRFRQMSLQSTGPQAMHYPNIARELGITAEQMKSLEALRKEESTAMLELSRKQSERYKEMARMGTDVLYGLSEKSTAEFKALRASYGQRVLTALTQQQRMKWKSMIGKPFSSS